MLASITRTIVFLSIVLGVIAGVLRLTCLRWWQVPVDDADLAASIAPSLGAGDWVILWRATAPGFGDLVVCPDPEDPAEVFIGRIAAEGRDRLTVDEVGVITVNNARARSEHACDPANFSVENPSNGEPLELRCDVETLGGVHHKRALVPNKAPLKPLPLKNRQVELGSVFLISDNRLFPFDSRDFGPLPKEACKERVAFRLVSRLGFSDVDNRLSWIH